MLCSLDEFKLRQLLAGTPQALHLRAFNDMEQNARDHFNIHCVGNGAGTITIDITRSNRESVMQWLMAAPISCVSLKENDIPVLLGHSVDALVVKTALSEGNATARNLLTDIAPTEIFDRLQECALELQAVRPEVGEYRPWATPESTEQDLINAGLLKPGEGSGARLEPEKPAEHEIGAEFRSMTEDYDDVKDPFTNSGYLPAGF